MKRGPDDDPTKDIWTPMRDHVRVERRTRSLMKRMGTAIGLSILAVVISLVSLLAALWRRP